MEYPKLSTHEQALHQAVEQGDAETAMNLLRARHELDINVNRKNPDNFESTILHVAAKAGLADMCHYLMTLGGCVYWRNRDGFTPSKLAKESGHHELADFLRSAERNPPKMLNEYLEAFLPKALTDSVAA